MLESLSAFDTWLYRFINLSLTAPALDPWALLISSNSFWVVLAMAATVWAAIRRDVRLAKILCLVILTVAVSDLICTYELKPAFHRVRPCHWMDHARRVNGICGSGLGMPSNHASNGAAVVAIVGHFFSRRWLWIAAAFSLLVGYSRVYLGVHFPGDVLAGYGLGCFIGAVFSRIARRWILPS